LSTPPPSARVGTGVQGLDAVLGGGLPRDHIYLIIGESGAGKTTLAMHFLLEGRAKGEVGLYVTFSETREDLRATAASHGWSLDGVDIYELTSAEQVAGLTPAQTLFHPAEVELNETTKGVLEVVDRIRPQRVVFDSLAEVRLLARDPLRYRRQILGLKQVFAGRSCTVLLLDDGTSTPEDLQLDSLAHGVLQIEQLVPAYGPERRRFRVKKVRGLKYHGGYHDFRIVTGGIHAYPRLSTVGQRGEFVTEPLSSDIPALDALLGGGVDRGTSTLIGGPAGTGKTTLALQFALAAAGRGERAAIYLFEEGVQNIEARAKGLRLPLSERVREGLITIRQVDPAEMTPGELAHDMRQRVMDEGVRMVMLDTLNGYVNAMPEDRFLALHMRELVTFLNNMGVATVLTESLPGPLVVSGVDSLDMSLLVDTVVLLRHFESRGAVHQAVSVLKKRTGRHERTIRELRLDEDGIHIGGPLVDLHGVLTGLPTHAGSDDPLPNGRDEPPTRG
jgi:circadian clock protein KaiC